MLAQRLLRLLLSALQEGEQRVRARRLGVEYLASVPASKTQGYAGRVPIVQSPTPSDELRDAIVRGRRRTKIARPCARSTLRDYAMRLVSEGVTSMDEVNRVLSEDFDSLAVTHRTRSRILVADDEPITRMLVKVLLGELRGARGGQRQAGGRDRSPASGRTCSS